MSDWEEQKAMETNEFEIGNRAIAYTFHGVAYGVVVDKTAGAVGIKVDGKPETYETCWFSFKQCRLLKKREAREWWVHSADFCGKRDDTSQGQLWNNKWDASDLDADGKWIKVREVLE